MRIIDLLKEKGIDLAGKPASKEETIQKLVQLMANTGNIADPEVFRKAVMARETEGSTGIGEGVAIPHGKSPVVKDAGLSPWLFGMELILRH